MAGLVGWGTDMKKCLCVLPFAALLATSAAQAEPATLQDLISQHAAANGIPDALVHRIVKRESNYNPQAVGRGGALGLMQIKHATARGMGYTGSASGLLDADTNLTYAVPYLAGAYRVAGGNQDRAVAYYASGYYYVAKRLGLTKTVARGTLPTVRYAAAAQVDQSASVAPAATPDTQVLAEMR
jgi:soluble lytic murein transglycosylase-like protein